jgi:hypothetical protein
VANVLSLALKINADASGLKLDPVEKALQRLGAETDKVGKVFEKFSSDTGAGARAQSDFARNAKSLADALKSGQLTAKQYADEFAKLTESANKEAAALERAARITEANISPRQKFTRATAELREQLNAGRISQETFNRAMEKAKADLNNTSNSAKGAESALKGVASQVRLIATIQVGQAVVSGLRAIASAASSFVQQIRGIVSGVTRSLDAIDKLSIRTGITTKALQGYGVAAKLAGVDTEQFATSVTRLGVSIGKADQGGAFDKTLKSIGLSLKELRSLAPEKQFTTIAESIRGLPTDAARAAAAVEIFGRQGAALIPLFREGSENIDELLKRAERLGIVVGQTQIDNITKLNDTFQLVRSTIEGIIGQVAGNLAPLVTSIAEEFLQFVETFEGSGGQGGTGIANAITDTLLKGAEFLGGVFDKAVADFSGFALTLENTSEVFRRVTLGLQSIFEAGRALFSLFQTAGNAITLGVGKLLEQLGRIPFLSDLKQVGRDLADAAFEQLENNAERFGDAVASSLSLGGQALFGETPDEAGVRGAGAAESYMREFREKLERERSPQFRVETNIEATQKKLDQFLSAAGDGADEFLVASKETLATFKATLEAGEDNANVLKIMAGFAERVNQQLAEENQKRQEAVRLAQAQANEDAKRIDALLKVSEAGDKVAQDLAAVEREIARVQAQVSQGGDDSSSVRLEQLRDLQAQLEDQLEATAQGFTEGFQKAFDATDKGFDGSIKKATEFGKAGFDAAVRLQEGIALAQQQARDGILNREAFDQEVARQKELFDKQLADIKALADERKRVNDFVDQQLELARFNGDQQRLQAAKNVVALEAEIGRVQQEIQAARAAGDNQAVQAAVQRLAQLDQVAAKERDIASGRLKAEQELAKRRDEAIKAEQQRQSQIQQEQKRAQEERAKAAAAEADRQAKRIRALNSIGQQSVGGADIRTSQGASAFVQAAAGAFDPNLAQLRAQTKLLQQIFKNSGALQFLERGIGATVQFLGGGRA